MQAHATGFFHSSWSGPMPIANCMTLSLPSTFLNYHVYFGEIAEDICQLAKQPSLQRWTQHANNKQADVLHVVVCSVSGSGYRFLLCVSLMATRDWMWACEIRRYAMVQCPEQLMSSCFLGGDIECMKYLLYLLLVFNGHALLWWFQGWLVLWGREGDVMIFCWPQVVKLSNELWAFEGEGPWAPPQIIVVYPM